MLSGLVRLVSNDEKGATLLEYVLIAGIIVLGVYATFTALKNSLVTKINSLQNTVTNAGN